MRISYDREADAAYLSFHKVDREAVKRTMACESSVGMINFDFGEDDRLLGIEFIEAQVLLPAKFLESSPEAAVVLWLDRQADVARLQFQESDPRHQSFYADDDFTNLRIIHDDYGKIRVILLSRASEVLPVAMLERLEVGADSNLASLRLPLSS